MATSCRKALHRCSSVILSNACLLLHNRIDAISQHCKLFVAENGVIAIGGGGGLASAFEARLRLRQGPTLVTNVARVKVKLAHCKACPLS